jgi:hypothetical protein
LIRYLSELRETGLQRLLSFKIKFSHHYVMYFSVLDLSLIRCT